MVFFHHVEKTGGTTVRAIFQRHQQLGLFDFMSFVGRQNRLQFQLILSRLDGLLQTADGLRNLRLAVELHVGGDMVFPYFLYYTLPDLLLMRQKLRAAGCRCNLVSLLRLPLLQELSWHSHFVNTKAPLCVWQGAADCSTRMALGLSCHEVPREPKLTRRHEEAVDGMWRLFDLVGTTEYFREFVLQLSDLVGLPHPGHVSQLVDRAAAVASGRLRRWAALKCSSMTTTPPRRLFHAVERRLNASREQGLRLNRRLECNGYGCTLSDRRYSGPFRPIASQCNEITALDVIQRICSRVSIDERVYHRARTRFITVLRRSYGGPAHNSSALQARLASLDAANALLSLRARRQQREIGSRRSDAARDSCVRCSGDVVPEFDLLGCWPLWGQFSPDEHRFRCSRSWTADPAYPKLRGARAAAPLPAGRNPPLACWQTCWTPIATSSSTTSASKPDDRSHCTPACPSMADAPRPLVWRAAWDRELERWKATTAAGQAFTRLADLFAGDAQRGGSWHASYRRQAIFRVF